MQSTAACRRCVGLRHLPASPLTRGARLQLHRPLLPSRTRCQVNKQDAEATFQTPSTDPAAYHSTATAQYGQPQYASPPQQQQQYYVGAPPPPPTFPVAPVQTVKASSGIAWWIWMAAGFALAKLSGVIQDLMQKGPQRMVAEMAMKQMMSQMSGGQAGSMPTGSPFGGAMPPFGGAPGMSPFGSVPGQNPFANLTPPSASTSTYDVTATTVGTSNNQQQQQQPPAQPEQPAQQQQQSFDGRGEKFKSRLNGEGRASPEATPAATSASPKMDVVEPEVKEPSRASSSSPSSSSYSKPSFGFTDVDVNEQPQQQLQQQQQQQGASSSAGGGGSATPGSPGVDGGAMTAMMEQMLRSPEMQKMLYPYLPEPMRNPDSIEWMLNNPEVRAQMEQVFAQQNIGMTPQMMEMMKGMDFSQDKVQAQFNELGLKPEDVVQQVMANPDLASGFSNPKVQQAIFDISQNPMNIMKYQNEPEIMKVLEKVTEIFSPQVQNGGMR